MGRIARPVELLEFEKAKNHKSRKQLEERKKSKLSLGEVGIFEPPDNVKSDPVAFLKWQELKGLYEGLSFITTADSDSIACYCLTYSEHDFYIKAKKSIISDLKRKKKPFIEILKEIRNIDTMINKKNELLIRLSERIFLSPTSRMKVLPPQDKKVPEKTELEKRGFGGI